MRNDTRDSPAPDLLSVQDGRVCLTEAGFLLSDPLCVVSEWAFTSSLRCR